MESTENKDAKIELCFHDLTFNGLKLSAKTSRLVVNRVGPEHRGSLPIITQHPDKTSTSPLKALAFVSRLQKKTKRKQQHTDDQKERFIPCGPDVGLKRGEMDRDSLDSLQNHGRLTGSRHVSCCDLGGCCDVGRRCLVLTARGKQSIRKSST